MLKSYMSNSYPLNMESEYKERPSHKNTYSKARFRAKQTVIWLIKD